MIGAVISAIAFLVASGHGKLRLLLDHALDVLDDHDGVVDHDADGEHQRQQRDGVGRIADRQHHREGADDRHRHGDQRDQRRPQLAEEQEDHQATRTKASTSVRTTSSIVEVTKTVVSKNTV